MGLPSRAAFKIEELIKRNRLVTKGARIVDLGCAPGGWLAILAAASGPDGRVVGVDLATVKNPPAGAIAIAGDILDPAVVARVQAELGGLADLVTSDLAPKLTGIAARDEARSRELIASASRFAIATLKPGGAMVVKLFMGAQFKDIVDAFKEHFTSVEVTRTRASRPGSSELYLIARGFRA
jgi:23S rRNA (uridine2552-2'-O)-methyltransferase